MVRTPGMASIVDGGRGGVSKWTRVLVGFARLVRLRSLYLELTTVPRPLLLALLGDTVDGEQ